MEVKIGMNYLPHEALSDLVSKRKGDKHEINII